MDDLLSEKEQVERLRQWWRENGWFLIGGAALGALGLFGWKQYGDYQERQAEEAASLYQQVQDALARPDTEGAVALLERLRADFPKQPYTQQASLLVARNQLVSAPDRAADELRYTMQNSTDPELAMVARLRLARVLAYREQYQDALDLLSVENPGQFAGRISEIRGDIYASLGRVDEARAAYLAAMVSAGAEVLDRNFLQMKLGDLPQRASEGGEPTAEASAGAATPAPSETQPDAPPVAAPGEAE